VPRVVTPENGVLVPAGDPALLADALLPLLADPALRTRLGQAGRAQVRARFGQDAWVARLLALYRDLLGQPAAPPPQAPEAHRCAS